MSQSRLCSTLPNTSCSNSEYYDFLRRLCQDDDSGKKQDSYKENTLIPEPVTAIVESQQVCRHRPVATKDGAIRLGASMDKSDLSSISHKLHYKARERQSEQAHDKAMGKEWSQKAAWELGLQRVYRTSSRVSHCDFAKSLRRLLALEHQSAEGSVAHDTRQRLRAGLAGNGLGVADRGQFCHLADDGSIVIPHDWI